MAIAKLSKTLLHGKTKNTAAADEDPEERRDIQGSRIPWGRQIKLNSGLWSCGPGRKGHCVTNVAQGISVTKAEGHLSNWGPEALKNALPQTTCVRPLCNRTDL